MVPITAFYAALMGILIVNLGSRAAMCRRKNQVGIGDGGNKELQVLIRAHGNAIENIPITLLLMLMAEMNGLSAVLLHISGVVLVVARLAHAKGYIDSEGKASKGRVYGVTGTWLLIMALAVANILLVWFH